MSAPRPPKGLRTIASRTWQVGDRAETLQTILVEPLGTGWIVDVCGLVNQMFFARETSAEAVARDLAKRLAAAGEGVQVEHRMRGGAVVARYLLFPAPANEDGPLWRLGRGHGRQA